MEFIVKQGATNNYYDFNEIEQLSDFTSADRSEIAKLSNGEIYETMSDVDGDKLFVSRVQ